MLQSEPPRTRYAQAGGLNIAYQTVGTGAQDLVFVPWFNTHVEVQWEEPLVANFLQRLASYGRVIIFDKRGAGISDPVSIANPPTLEEWMDDVRVVMDAVGSERAALIAHSGGGTMAMLFAATFPARVTHLVLLECYPRLVSTADHPAGVPPTFVEASEALIRSEWGTGRFFGVTAPSLAEDPGFSEWLGRYERMSMSPGAALATVRMLASIDLRSVLPLIQAPTLILHRRDNPVVNVEQGRYLASHIPHARLVELAGNDHAFFAGDTRRILDEIGGFVSGAPAADPDRVLATVVFTDIVDSTRHATRLGDAQWAALLDRHDAGTKRLVSRFRGRIVKRTGDGTLATFDGPARAIQCATALRDAMRGLGVELRTGLHTGEIVIREDDVGGVAVHVAARVQAAAQAGEVLVSSTVRDLVAGSGIGFADRGLHVLKGLGEPWHLYGVAA